MKDLGGRSVPWRAIIVGSLAVLAVAVCIVLYTRWRHAGLEYRILFRDAQGLREGDAVTLAGTRVGSVKEIGYDKASNRAVVTVRIDEDKRELVKGTGDSSARIMKDGWVVARRRVELINRGTRESTMEGGSTVEGLESWSAEQVFRGKGLAQEGVEDAKAGLARARESLDGLLKSARENVEAGKQYASGPEREELKAQIEEVRRQIEEYSLEQKDKAAELAAEAIEKGKKLAVELRAKGQGELATELESTFVEWKERAAAFVEKGKRIVEEKEAKKAEEAVAPGS